MDDTAQGTSQLESVQRIVAEQLAIGVDQVGPDSTFASLGADDLDLVEIIMTTEEAHGVAIPDDVLMKIAGVSATEELVERLTIRGLAGALTNAEPLPDSVDSQGQEKPPVGPYSELVKLPLPEGHVLVFIPSLSTSLYQTEEQAGRPLTEDEVLSIRDRAPTMMLPADVLTQLNASRGYEDIGAENCWLEWQALKGQPK